MPFNRRQWSLAAALAVAVGLVGSNVGAERSDTGDPRAAFRRPAALDASSATLPQDRVWALGQKLFFDPRLSASSTLACASCHQPGHAWTNNLPKAIGEAHRPLAFRAPTLLNAGTIDRYGWTGRFADVEAVTFFAMTSPGNMNLPIPQLLGRLEADADYGTQFRSAFPEGGISKHNIGMALSRFVRSITSGVAPFDLWVAGDRDAVSAEAARGFAIFSGKGKCAECHRGWAFTDGSFHDIGIGKGGDIGRGTLFKSSVKLQYAFKTPTLRDVAARGPYMHDGSLQSLEEVVDQYDKGGIARPSRAAEIGPLHLSAQEKADLIAFLKTLTGGSSFSAAQQD